MPSVYGKVHLMRGGLSGLRAAWGTAEAGCNRYLSADLQPASRGSVSALRGTPKVGQPLPALRRWHRTLHSRRAAPQPPRRIQAEMFQSTRKHAHFVVAAGSLYGNPGMAAAQQHDRFAKAAQWLDHGTRSPQCNTDAGSDGQERCHAEDCHRLGRIRERSLANAVHVLAAQFCHLDRDGAEFVAIFRRESLTRELMALVAVATWAKAALYSCPCPVTSAASAL